MIKLKLRTKIPVTFNDISRVTGTKNVIVEGYIENSASLINFTEIGVNYIYQEVDGTLIKKDSKSYSHLTVDQLYTVIKLSIPKNLGYSMTQQWVYYLAFQQEMATTFGISPDDIEIVELEE